jgi:hypothetical protein
VVETSLEPNKNYQQSRMVFSGLHPVQLLLRNCLKPTSAIPLRMILLYNVVIWRFCQDVRRVFSHRFRFLCRDPFTPALPEGEILSIEYFFQLFPAPFRLKPFLRGPREMLLTAALNFQICQNFDNQPIEKGSLSLTEA